MWCPAALSLLFVSASFWSGDAQGADAFAGHTFYFGDPHVHTGASLDGGSSDLGTCEGSCGAARDVVASAKANGLDWLAVVDHVNGRSTQSAADFTKVRDLVLAGHDPGKFVTIPGAEVWFTVPNVGPLGHRSLYFFGDDAALRTLTIADTQPAGNARTEVRECANINTWMTRLSGRFGEVLLIPHHPSATLPMPTNWDCFHPAWEPAVEVYSAHGNALWDGTSVDATGQGSTATGTVQYAMRPSGLGLHLGFIAGTDSHDTRPGGVCELDTEMPRHPYAGGLTAVVLRDGEHFDRHAIHEAMVQRRTYATTGPRVPATINWSAGGVVIGELGAELAVPAGRDLQAVVQVPPTWAAMVSSVTLVTPEAASLPMQGDGAGAWKATVASADIPAYLYAAITLDGRAQPAGCVDGGASKDEWVWLSPSFITRAGSAAEAAGTEPTQAGSAAPLRAQSPETPTLGVNAGYVGLGSVGLGGVAAVGVIGLSAGVWMFRRSRGAQRG